MQINEIIENAKKMNGLKSDRQLAHAIGLSQPAMFHIVKGRGLPSDETMLKLAELAGIDSDRALIMLNIWRTEGTTKDAYSALLKRIASGTACFAILAGSIVASPTPAMANCYDMEKILYIMELNE